MLAPPPVNSNVSSPVVLIDGMERKMGKLFVAFSLIVSLLVGCGRTEVREFSSIGGSFSVMMPGVPVEKVASMNMDVGSIDVHSYSLTQDDVGYGVNYMELPEDINEELLKDYSATMESGRDGMVARLKGRLVSDIGVTGKVKMDGRLGKEIRGKEIVVELPDGKHNAIGRIFWNQNVIYQVMAIAKRPVSFEDQAVIERYFESFVINQK